MQDTGSRLFRLVARQIAGLPAQAGDGEAVVVWTQGDDELTVLVDEATVTTALEGSCGHSGALRSGGHRQGRRSLRDR